MTLTELRYIVALFETGHFRKAAELCHVSQPTLSIAVKKLEEELDVTLFERSRHKVTATPIGERIVQQARTVLRETRNLEQLAEQGRDPLGSVLSVGAIYTVGPYLFPRLINRLSQVAPQMPLFIEENYTAVLRVKLSAGDLDAIFVALPFTEPDVVTRAVYDEPFVVLLRDDHPLSGEKQIEPDALACC
jgi:LysR family hydrogen peroxide-inducible transcriptional activator